MNWKLITLIVAVLLLIPISLYVQGCGGAEAPPPRAQFPEEIRKIADSVDVGEMHTFEQEYTVVQGNQTLKITKWESYRVVFKSEGTCQWSIRTIADGDVYVMHDNSKYYGKPLVVVTGDAIVTADTICYERRDCEVE